MDERTLLEKLFQFASVFVGSLFSFFIYRQKKLHDRVELLDDRADKIDINQAAYNKTVDFIMQRFDKVEVNQDRIMMQITQIEKILLTRKR